jgi:hypothetical protein
MQPFVPVTLTVYVPGVLTLILLFVVITVVPFDHEELTHPPAPEAANVITLILQSNTVVLAKDTIDVVGATISCVMFELAVPVHPFAPVTVTV